MLTLYHTPLSVNSRRVWVALLEKKLPFETIEMELSGDQLQPDFLSLNPFHHIPVLTDGELTVIESLAILDYLEAKYPTPSLLPTDPDAIATVRMIQMVTLNELVPAFNPLVKRMMGFGQEDPELIEQSIQKADVVLRFYADKLGQKLFFGGEQLTLADIVAGTFAPWFEQLGLPMINYPTLQAWTTRLLERPAWQKTQPTPADVEGFRERMQARMAAQGQ